MLLMNRLSCEHASFLQHVIWHMYAGFVLAVHCLAKGLHTA